MPLRGLVSSSSFIAFNGSMISPPFPHYCLFLTHAHFIQYRFFLLLRNPSLLPKDGPQEPVRSTADVILHLLREGLLNLLEGHMLSENCNAPEAEGFKV